MLLKNRLGNLKNCRKLYKHIQKQNSTLCARRRARLGDRSKRRSTDGEM